MQRKVDPVTLSVLQGRLESITREMTWVVVRTARSAIFKYSKDFSNGIYDSRGQILVQGEKDLPFHLGSMQTALASVVEFFGDDIHDGDVIYHNDPATGGAHLPDMVAATPLFVEDELIFWIASKEHMLDTGGMSPGGYIPAAEEIYQEGIRIPPLKIFDRGKEKKDVINLIMANLRFPVPQRGDLEASLAAIRLAKASLREIVLKYGRQTIKDCIAEMIDMGEKRMRDAIRAWPSGVYEGSAWVEAIRDIPDMELKVKVTVRGDEVEVAWDTPPQVPAFINSYYGNTLSAIYMSILIASRLRPPFNIGYYRPIKVDFGRPGTMTNARVPAACGNSTTTIGQNLLNAMRDALRRFLPQESLTAGWGSCVSAITSSTNPRTRKYYAEAHSNAMGSGGGAVWGVDGFPGALSEVSAGATTRPEVEDVENEIPWLIHHSQFRTDSSGAGRWRGAPGTEYEVEFPDHKNISIYPIGEGEEFLPPGVDGARNTLIEPKRLTRYFTRHGEKIPSERGRPAMFNEDRGEVLVLDVQGGGGVGDPFERDIEAVMVDVLNEIVSIEGARLDYGVVIDLETFEVNEKETSKLRGERISGKN